MPEAFKLLMEDHRKVESLFEQFEQSEDFGVAMKICEELTIHATLEEELIYPLARAKVSTGRVDEARREHQQAKDLITEIEGMGPEGAGLRSTMQQLKESVLHHVQEEEQELFPKIEQTIGATVANLGADIIERKQQLLANIDDDKSIGLAPSVMGQKPNAAPT